MRRRAQASTLCFLLLFLPSIAAAKENDSILKRILNPLPEYDPFEAPPPAPQFFPDVVERRAREALIDSLTGQETSLKGHIRVFAERDAALQKERGTVTGLTERVRDLLHNGIRERERYLEAQKEALSSASPGQKKLIQSRLQNDDLTQAESLLRKIATRRWGALFNRLLRSVNLLSILSGSYIGAAVDSTMAQLLSSSSPEMPSEERRALTYYLEHLKRHPNDPRNDEIRKKVDRLQKKKKGALVQKQVEKAKEAAAKRDLERALFNYEIASLIDPEAAEADLGVKDTRKLLLKREEARKAGLTLVSAGRERGRSGLLYALSLREPKEIEAEAKTLEEKGESAPTGAARDAAAIALEIQGQHEQAKKILEEIARSSPDPHEQRRAEALLKSAEYNLLASFHQARAERRIQTVKYVLLGDDLLKKNLLYGTGSLIASGAAGAPSLAGANLLMIGTNLFEVLTSNPVSLQAIIDKGVAYIGAHPESESATEVYAILGEAYEEAGIYDRAIDYYLMSGRTTEKKISDLKDKAARFLLQAAEKSAERRLRESYLMMVLDEYPESSAAEEARQKLSALSKIENRGLRMSKKFLLENPELYGREGLRLKPTLFDGNSSNMELADRGVNIVNEREIILHFQTPWGVRSQPYPIEKESGERLEMALRKRHYEVALTDIDARPKGSPGGIPSLPPSILKPELERNIQEHEHTTFTLVREAGEPRPPLAQVLARELIAESEKKSMDHWKLPPVQGGISGSGLSFSSPLPIPLLQGFIPVDFLLQGGPGHFSVSPKIQIHKDQGDDRELYH